MATPAGPSCCGVSLVSLSLQYFPHDPHPLYPAQVADHVAQSHVHRVSALLHPLHPNGPAPAPPSPFPLPLSRVTGSAPSADRSSAAARSYAPSQPLTLLPRRSLPPRESLVPRAFTSHTFRRPFPALRNAIQSTGRLHHHYCIPQLFSHSTQVGGRSWSRSDSRSHCCSRVGPPDIEVLSLVRRRFRPRRGTTLQRRILIGDLLLPLFCVSLRSAHRAESLKMDIRLAMASSLSLLGSAGLARFGNQLTTSPTGSTCSWRPNSPPRNRRPNRNHALIRRAQWHQWVLVS